MNNKKINMRRIVQILFFTIIGMISINKALAESGGGIAFLSQSSLHALCPFGGVVTLYNLFTLGTFIKKIHMSSVILMTLVFALAVLFGPVFCGWVCPLGSIQEWTGKIGKKIFSKKFNNFIPKNIDKYFRYFRYLVFIMVVYVTSKSGYLMFSNIDPYNALFTFWTHEVSIPALIILIITLVASIFIERPWCKYLCPYGALLGLFNKIRIFKIRRNAASCISCRNCDRVCPMNIEVSNTDKVNNLQCISCYECTSESHCPKPDTINMKAKNSKNVKIIITGVLVMTVIFGGIAATIAADIWSTTTSKTLAKYREGEYAGTYNPEDIRGSYTFKEVSDLFEIDIKVLYKAFGINEKTDGTKIKTKDLETLYGGLDAEIGNESVQAFVALYKNLPISLNDAYLPRSAVEIIFEANKKMTDEQKSYLESHQIELTGQNINIEINNEISEKSENEESQLVNGSTTFQQVLDKGITKEQIEKIIGSEMPSSNQTIKDYCINNNLPFSQIKERINELDK